MTPQPKGLRKKAKSEYRQKEDCPEVDSNHYLQNAQSLSTYAIQRPPKPPEGVSSDPESTPRLQGSDVLPLHHLG